MSLLSINNVTILAIAACVPKKVKKVIDFNLISETDRLSFIQGTGIEETRIVEKSTCTSDLCYESANKIIKDLNIQKSEIDILIFVSQSPDYFLPATSILLQQRLGLGKHVMAFDINLGCSGYVYGLSVISNLLSSPNFNKALLLCGDVSTFSLSNTDKSTYPLFGDAGTATLLSRVNEKNTMHFNLQTDGSGKNAIIIKGGATRNPPNEFTYTKKIIEPGIERCERDLELDGVEVFNFALREVKPNILELLNFSATKLEEIDFLIMHQANKLMNESVRKKLNFPLEKTPYSLQKFGNTSSASIPLTMVTAISSDINNKKIILAGFGVGFSWGSAVINTKQIKILDLIEI